MTRFYTFKKQVPLKPGERLGYQRGKGYYVIPAAKPAPVPPPPIGLHAQKVVLMSGTQDTPSDWVAEFVACGPGHGILFSADLNEAKPGGAYYVTDRQLEDVKRGGGWFGWWCDGTATPISEAKKLLAQRGGSAVMGQFETDAQYDALVNSGVPLGVGDAANLSQPRRDDAIRRCNSGELHLTGEMMWCNPAYSAFGIPIESVTLYVDRDASQGGYQPLSAYEPLPAGLKASCCLYTGGKAHPEDWATWRAWTA